MFNRENQLSKASQSKPNDRLNNWLSTHETGWTTMENYM